jgi:hypothetical protein
MKVYRDMVQGTEEWKRLRLGKVTGTRLKDLMAKDNLPLIDQLIAESVSGQIPEVYVNAAMQWGIDNEPDARMAYELETNRTIEQVAFIVSDKYDWLGMSPDGLQRIDGKYRHGIEIKCPNTANHVKCIRQNQVPNEYKYQVYSMFLINPFLDTHDFISYDSRFDVRPLHIVRTKREDIVNELIEIENVLVKFHKKYLEYYQQIVKF